MTTLPSLLFIPCVKLARFVAHVERSTGNDVPASIIFDLEDSVPDHRKADARQALAAAIHGILSGLRERSEIFVRVNSVGTADYRADIAALRGLQIDGLSFMLPKVERTADIDELLTSGVKVTPQGILPTIETLDGFAVRRDLAAHCAQVGIPAIAFGAGDSSAELGVERDYSLYSMRYMMGALLVECTRNGIALIDSPSRVIPHAQLSKDWEDIVRAECRQSFRNGFAGKMAIHPDQVPVINYEFDPERRQDWARSVLTDFAAEPQYQSVRSTLSGAYMGKPTLSTAKRFAQGSRKPIRSESSRTKGVLLTSVGSRAGEGVIACLRSQRRRLRLIGTNSVAAAPGLHDCDVGYLTPETVDREGFTDRIVEILETERPAAVINCRDEELTPLAKIADSGRFPDTRFLMPSGALAGIFADKYEMAMFVERRGLPMARSAVEPTQVWELIADKGYPIITKPRIGGHASKNVHLLFDEQAVQAALTEDNIVFQEFVGPEILRELLTEIHRASGTPWIVNLPNTCYSIDFVIGNGGRVISRFLVQLERNGSIATTLRLLDDAELRGIADLYAAALSDAGHVGPVDIQGYKTDAGYFVPYELNARFFGSVQALDLLGRNPVETAVRHFLFDETTEEDAPVNDVRVIRTMVYRKIACSEVDRLNSERHLLMDPANRSD
jgi:citrate lyase subunit beta/citryl-CoA lyase